MSDTSTAAIMMAVVIIGAPLYIAYRAGYRRGFSKANQGVGTFAPMDEKRYVMADKILWPVKIKYRNFQGEASERTVDVQCIYGDKESNLPSHIDGYCHKRKERRTFRLDRVDEIIDLRTGVISADPIPVIVESLKRAA